MRVRRDITSGAGDAVSHDIRFPWIGVSAPLIASIAFWAISGSPMSLIFGLISPLTLVAHFADARRSSRRRSERHSREQEQAQRESDGERQRKHQADVAESNERYPAAARLAQLAPISRKRPRDDGVLNGKSERKSIRLGVHADGHPFTVQASDGVVVEGQSQRARAIRRAVTAQVWWLAGDPHVSVENVVTSRRGNGRWLVIVDDALNGHERDSMLDVIDRDAPGVARTRIIPDEASADELAHLRNVLVSFNQTPSTLTPLRTVQTTSEGMSIAIGETRERNPVEFDLVTHGPHAIISGTTGSGKTTFIVNWLLRMADRFPPSQLEIAVIDFKGGVDFVGLSTIPHCVGMATDVEESSIERALAALRVEMGRRERLLRDAKTIDISALPRLFVVIDEFRATAAAHPHAVTIVEDLVARGRALGVHVVLSTQRASTSISEDIIANVPVRIAFRALSASESRFMVGTDLACSQVRDVGEAVISSPSADPILFRAARPGSTPTEKKSAPLHDSAETCVPRPRELWKPALPIQLFVSDVQRLASCTAGGSAGLSDRTPGAVVVGLADSPQTQDWRSVSLNLVEQGHLLVCGSTRSGRTSTVRLIVEQYLRSPTEAHGQVDIRWPSDACSLWDELDERHSGHTEGNTTLLIVDGIERHLAMLPVEFREMLVERLTLMLRIPGSRRCVVTCDSTGAWESRFGHLFAQRLNLVGGSSRPGKAVWSGMNIQIALPESTTTIGHPSADKERYTAPTPTTCVLVSRKRGDALTTALNALSDAGISVVESGSPDEWMTRLSDFAALSADHAIVVSADVGSSDARVLLRTHTPLPPIASGGALMLLPNGSYKRVTL